MEPNPKLRKKTFTISVKDLSESEPRTLMMTGSTESPDRDKDILMSSGWNLDNYVKNPVVLWAHDYSKPAVAMAKSVYSDKRNKRLEFKLYFPTIAELSSDTEHPSDHALFVDTLYNMYKSGMMNASSVGYLGKEMEARTDQDNEPVWNRGLLFTKQELVELSLVPVPANAEALVQARSMKSIDKRGVDLVEKAMLDEESSKKGEEDMADKLTEEEVTRLKAFAANLPKKDETKKKAGRKLSAASLAKINEAMDHVGKCMDMLKGLASDGVETQDDDVSDGVEKPADGKPGEKKEEASGEEKPKPGEEKPEEKPKPGEEKPKPGAEKALDLSTMVLSKGMTVEQANDILRQTAEKEGV